ncbi:hypothetical protein BC941DRAFT_500677 [Chlamydoabsidia padenii]|nr:hypothetical protein BC941DRAFT_500677 [Chlamydoabsidia padenii]
MSQQDDFARIFSCSQCPKMFATRSNLKRHMENPNIHNIPYVRSRDQKRWKGHAKKIVSKEETTERVYRLARQKFGDQDSVEKQTFIRDEIIRRLGRRTNIKSKSFSASSSPSSQSNSAFSSMSPPPVQRRLLYHRRSTVKTTIHNKYIDDDEDEDDDDDDDDREDEDMENRPWKSELPFYNMPHQKIELPSIDSLCPSLISSTNLRRRTSSSSESSISTTTDDSSPSSSLVLPPCHTFLYHTYEQQPSYTTSHNTRYVTNGNPKILDEFVGVVLEFAQEGR